MKYENILIKSGSYPWKLISSYWTERDPDGHPCLQNCHLLLGKNGRTKSCNRTLCDLFRRIWTFLWQSELHRGERQSLSVPWVDVFPHSSPCDVGFRCMNDTDRLTVSYLCAEVHLSPCQCYTKLGARAKTWYISHKNIKFYWLIFSCKSSGSRLCAKRLGDQEGAEVVFVTVVPRQLLIITPALHSTCHIWYKNLETYFLLYFYSRNATWHITRWALSINDSLYVHYTLISNAFDDLTSPLLLGTITLLWLLDFTFP